MIKCTFDSLDIIYWYHKKPLTRNILKKKRLTSFKRLKEEGPGNLRSEKTVNLFLADEIMSMPYETYHMTLEAFERGISLDQYYRLMDQRGIFDRSYHRRLVAKMFQSDVLY